MADDAYLPAWIDPRQEFRLSSIHGMGAFARAAIQPGETVEVFGGMVMAEAAFRAMQQTTARYNAIQIDEDRHLVELAAATAQRRGSLNHCCDSNLWMRDAVTIVARRAIAAGEELTVDYALFSAQETWSLDGICRCGAADCRGRITGQDWQLPLVRQRYFPHFSPFINQRIAQRRPESLPARVHDQP